LGLNRNRLRQLAQIRLDEAKLLLDNGRYSGAYYLAGYTAECALKACIAKLIKAEDFPDKKFADKCYSHDLQNLLRLAGLETQFLAEVRANTALRDNWDIAKDWNEEARYEVWTQSDATNLYQAIADPKGGVMQWIRNHW